MDITAAYPLPTAGGATMRGAYFGQIAWDAERKVATMDHPKFIEGLAYWVDLKLKHRVVPSCGRSGRLWARPIPVGAPSGNPAKWA